MKRKQSKVLWMSGQSCEIGIGTKKPTDKAPDGNWYFDQGFIESLCRDGIEKLFAMPADGERVRVRVTIEVLETDEPRKETI